MELTLLRQVGTQISVVCDGQLSHTFDLRAIVPDDEKRLVNPPTDPVAYGTSLFRVLFPAETSARTALDGSPDRILLVTTDNELDAVPWEYTYGPTGLEASEDFLVPYCHFLRGLPAPQRTAPPALKHGLHIIAIPSHPLSHTLDPLNIEGEWMRLKDSILALPYAVTLERTRPSKLERVRHLVANQHARIVQFMAHGGQNQDDAGFCFEKNKAEPAQWVDR